MTAPGLARIGRWLAYWFVVTCIVVACAIVGLRIWGAVAGILVPYLDNDYLKQRVADQFHYREFLATEHALERALVSRWREGNQTFTLADIYPLPVARACVRTERKKNADYLNNPSADLAVRSIRPWWWGELPQSSTIVVESANGSVSAFRLVGSGYTYVGMGTRLRFVFLNRNFVCGIPAMLLFAPQQREGAAATFLVTEGERK